MDLKELDRQVAEALGRNMHKVWMDSFTPSTNGQQAMNLIREYGINIMVDGYDENDKPNSWETSIDGAPWVCFGSTPEIAIAKAIVAMKGDE